MAEASRRKGARGEREAAEALGATKISRAYQPGEDLDWRGRAVEVKRRADGFKSLYKWLDDAGLVMMRADRKDWLVAMRVEELLDLMEEARRLGWDEADGF